MAFNFDNSLKRDTPILFYLITINVLVYLAQLAIPSVTEWGSLHYYKSSLFHPHQFITSVFMHDPKDVMHLLFNMFTLWMFGTTLEKYLGPKHFLIFYLICGIGAGIVIELSTPFSVTQYSKSAEAVGVAIRNNMSTESLIASYLEYNTALGASGAIMGVMAAFAYLFPNTEMMLIFFPIPIKAKFIIPCFILLEVFYGVRQLPGDNVGHFAHVGGAVVGFLVIYIWNKTNRKTFY